MNDINNVLAQLSSIGCQLDTSVSGARLLADTWSIVGADAQLNGCDAQARNAYHAAIKAGNTHPLLKTVAYEKSSAFGEYGNSGGHGEEMPFVVFEAWEEMYPGIESLEDLRQALALEGLESCVDSYSFVEGIARVENEGLECDRDSFINGEHVAKSAERKADALIKADTRDFNEKGYLKQWRDARFAKMVKFIAKGSANVPAAVYAWKGRYIESVKSCAREQDWYSLYLTKGQMQYLENTVKFSGQWPKEGGDTLANWKAATEARENAALLAKEAAAESEADFSTL